jgi:zinc transport system ATP-binding protein
MTSKPVVEIQDVSFAYNRMSVLEQVNLTFYEKDFIWIVGPNGGGKTTLMKLILGLLRPNRGTIKVFGKTPTSARKQIGYMPQHVHFDAHFPVTVMDVVLMGRLGSNFRMGSYSFSDKKAALKALKPVGLETAGNKSLHVLSGGQQRRLLIARALASEPDMLLLDEPTANLDLQVERELYRLLRKLNEELTIITVSHDPAFVSDFVKEVVCVSRGTVAVHPTSVVQGAAIDELYGGQVRMVRHDQHHTHVDDTKQHE